jgi:hypothetical protein
VVVHEVGEVVDEVVCGVVHEAGGVVAMGIQGSLVGSSVGSLVVRRSSPLRPLAESGGNSFSLRPISPRRHQLTGQYGFLP